jgi:hypothetical protein
MLMNGDACLIGQWVLVWSHDGQAPTIARVCEIIQRKGSEAESLSRPDAILLEAGTLQGPAQPYRMPAVKPQNAYSLLPVQVYSADVFGGDIAHSNL